MCGEKSLVFCCVSLPTGSPPHVRGKVGGREPAFVVGGITPACAGKSAHFKQALFQHLGITPACAGKRTVPELCVYTHKDHPRMCGEKQPPNLHAGRPAGSPPHVRGKVADTDYANVALGITPACAGKRGIFDRESCSDGDHPRMCGEKFFNPVSRRTSAGSPPHVRGKD